MLEQTPIYAHWEILHSLAHSANPAECAKHSFDNFHVRGLRYVNLLRTPGLTAKLYIAEPRKVEPVNGDWLVNPHDHAYAFHTYVLAGGMQNITFRDGPVGAEWERFRFESALNGRQRSAHEGAARLILAGESTLLPGDGYRLSTEQIHTIVVPRDRLTVLFLLQYRDEKTATRLYMPTPAPPTLDGLYQPLSAADVEAELDRVRRML